MDIICLHPFYCFSIVLPIFICTSHVVFILVEDEFNFWIMNFMSMDKWGGEGPRGYHFCSLLCIVVASSRMRCIVCIHSKCLIYYWKVFCLFEHGARESSAENGETQCEKEKGMNEWTFNWTFMVARFYYLGHLDCSDSVCRMPSSALSSCLFSSLWLIPFWHLIEKTPDLSNKCSIKAN